MITTVYINTRPDKEQEVKNIVLYFFPDVKFLEEIPTSFMMLSDIHATDTFGFEILPDRMDEFKACIAQTLLSNNVLKTLISHKVRYSDPVEPLNIESPQYLSSTVWKMNKSKTELKYEKLGNNNGN